VPGRASRSTACSPQRGSLRFAKILALPHSLFSGATLPARIFKMLLKARPVSRSNKKSQPREEIGIKTELLLLFFSLSNQINIYKYYKTYCRNKSNNTSFF
jgi:hypothetical protein